MSNDPSANQSEAPTLWERLSQLLIREPQDRTQLVDLLRDAEHRQLIDAEALAMIEGVIQVSDMQVRDIMIPRSQMDVITDDMPLDEFLPTVIETHHSRYPVIGDSRDEIRGVILAKDLLQYLHDDKANQFDMDDLIRPVIRVPESKRLDSLLQEFRGKRNHMAIVVDEYGGVSGLVTIEDVLEQIVGDIDDEYDLEEDAYISSHDDERFTVKALTPIEDFNEYFETKFSDEEFDTIGGLVINHFGRMPERGETTMIGEHIFKVIRADARRVRLLEVTREVKDDLRLAEATGV